jgi:hypothetical protein
MATQAVGSGANSGRAGRVAKWIFLHLLRAVWLSTMVLTPLFGFWLASSLAAYSNASQWLALLGGLLLFPIIPVGWDLFHVWRRSKQPPKKQILTRVDRLVLRTLIVNGVFLVAMMWFGRATAFQALAQRGDWALDGHDGPIATKLRGWMLGFADHFDRHKPDELYGSSDNAPDPSKRKPIDIWEPPPPKPGTVIVPKAPSGWPLSDEADPKVSEMPAAAKASIETVGAYLKEQFPDRKQRVKAIHDFVALHLDYDYDALKLIEAKDYANTPPETAEAVFARKKGVCEGYARLMVAVGKAANIEIMYVTGYIRDSSRRLTTTEASAKSALDGYLHAWNAVLIDDEWFLLDATWDDPTGAKKPVRSTYLFTPPKLFAYDHHPDDPAWQLVMSPISLGDFARQPFLSPSMGRLGVSLESPTRSQVTVSGEVTLVLDNPYGAKLLAYATLDNGKKGGAEIRCEIKPRSGGTKTDVTCELPDGEYEVRLFGASAGSEGWLDHLGSILVNSH